MSLQSQHLFLPPRCVFPVESLVHLVDLGDDFPPSPSRKVAVLASNPARNAHIQFSNTSIGNLSHAGKYVLYRGPNRGDKYRNRGKRGYRYGTDLAQCRRALMKAQPTRRLQRQALKTGYTSPIQRGHFQGDLAPYT